MLTGASCQGVQLAAYHPCLTVYAETEPRKARGCPDTSQMKSLITARPTASAHSGVGWAGFGWRRLGNLGCSLRPGAAGCTLGLISTKFSIDAAAEAEEGRSLVVTFRQCKHKAAFRQQLRCAASRRLVCGVITLLWPPGRGGECGHGSMGIPWYLIGVVRVTECS